VHEAAAAEPRLAEHRRPRAQELLIRYRGVVDILETPEEPDDFDCTHGFLGALTAPSRFTAGTVPLLPQAPISH
jgi:hypothetical protein